MASTTTSETTMDQIEAAVFTVEIPHQERHLGETRTHTLFTLDRRASALVTVEEIAEDVAAGDRGSLFAASYSWSHADGGPPVPALLAVLDDEETGGGPRHHPLDMVADGDDIQVRIGDAAPGRYTIVARVELAPEADQTGV